MVSYIFIFLQHIEYDSIVKICRTLKDFVKFFKDFFIDLKESVKYYILFAM